MDMPKRLHPSMAVVNYDVTTISHENAGKNYFCQIAKSMNYTISKCLQRSSLEESMGR